VVCLTLRWVHAVLPSASPRLSLLHLRIDDQWSGFHPAAPPGNQEGRASAEHRPAPGGPSNVATLQSGRQPGGKRRQEMAQRSLVLTLLQHIEHDKAVAHLHQRVSPGARSLATADREAPAAQSWPWLTQLATMALLALLLAGRHDVEAAAESPERLVEVTCRAPYRCDGPLAAAKVTGPRSVPGFLEALIVVCIPATYLTAAAGRLSFCPGLRSWRDAVDLAGRLPP